VQSLALKPQHSFAVFVRVFLYLHKRGRRGPGKLGFDLVPRGSYPLPGTR